MAPKDLGPPLIKIAAHLQRAARRLPMRGTAKLPSLGGTTKRR